MRRGAPVDLVFQSIAGTQSANRAFGVDLALLREANEAALALRRGTIGDNVMYFETGQGSALSAGAHHGCDQQTLEARAYGVARLFKPLLVNTVVGFIGPEYLFDGKQIIRAGLEDHFCGKLLGLPMGCDACYTNHAEADQNDIDDLLTLLAVAGVNYVMGVPGADDIMLNYQSTSYHDVLAVRRMLDWRRRRNSRNGLRHGRDGRARFAKTPGAARRRPAAARKGVNDDRDSPGDPRQTGEFARRDAGAHFSAARRPGVATPANLQFQLDHAEARDAVHERLDVEALIEALRSRGLEVLRLASAAPDRRTYLLRPDLGRELDEASRARLAPSAGDYDIVFVIADGLSARAVSSHAIALLDEALPAFQQGSWKLAPVVVVEQGRVAIGDEIGEILGAKLVAVLIGERPGLSSPDSLGVYLTFAPRVGRNDAERNCLSNIRSRGMSYSEAAQRLFYLCGEARRRNVTGVELKDETPLARGDDQSPRLGAPER